MDYPHEAIERLRRMRKDSAAFDGGYPDTPEGREQSLLDHAAIVNYALSIFPDGPRPEAIRLPYAGLHCWALTDSGPVSVCTEIDNLGIGLRFPGDPHLQSDEDYDCYRTRAEAILAKKWQAFERYVAEKGT